MLDDAEVVGDEQVGELEFLLEASQQVQDLGLDGDIQGRDGLIGNDQLWPQGKGPGYADALPLAAAELVGIAVHLLSRQPDLLHEQGHFLLPIPPPFTPWINRGSPMVLPALLRGLSDE